MKTFFKDAAWWAAVYGVAELDTTEATQQQQQQCVLAEFLASILALSLSASPLPILGCFLCVTTEI